LAFIAVSVFALTAGLSEAHARPGDQAWADCVWQTAPKTADTWLGEDAPAWNDNMQTRAELSGLRLMALCGAAAADEAKPNRLPKWRSIRRQLERRRPDAPAGQDAASAQTHLCESFAVRGDHRALYRADVVRVEGEERTITFQQYFSEAGTEALSVVDERGRAVSFQLAGSPLYGSPIRMPQVSMIVSPAEGFASEQTCRVIAADGTLTDA
jgi:hypothetical protein